MKKNELPLVSVIMPVYNAGAFLREAIESILTQTYENLELVIVDDGSSDSSATTITQYKRRFPKKIKAFFLKGNKGESVAANIGFRATKGEYIARMDADDISLPTRIEKQVRFMQNHPDVVVLGTQATIIDRSSKITGKKSFPTKHDDIYKMYAVYHPMLHPSCIFRKRLLPYKNKLWENKCEPNDDYITLFHLLNCGKFANLPEGLVKYRIHGGNKSLTNPRSRVLNFFRIRLLATQKYGYRPTFSAILINLSELMGILLLPEKFIAPTYMLLRSISTRSISWRTRRALAIPQSRRLQVATSQ